MAKKTKETKFEIKLNEVDHEKMLSTFSGLPRQFDIAAIRAINKTAKWLNSQIIKESSREIKIAQKHIKKRLLILKAKRSFKRALITIGLNQIPASILGIEKAKQTKTGVKLGRHNFPHAFLARMRENKPVHIWQRKTKKRFPIRMIGFPIEPYASKILETQSKRVNAILLKNMEHELNYEINIKGSYA